MLSSVEERIEARKTIQKLLRNYLMKVRQCRLLTIGDTMTYATYVYILEHLDKKYSVETVP